MEHTPKRYTQDTPAPLRRDGETVEAYRVRCGWDAPKTDALQRYGADLSDFAYSQERVRQMLDDAHAHYEAQVRPLAGLARPDADVADQVLGAMASAGKVARLTAKVADLSALLAKESTRNDTLVADMKDAARKLEGSGSDFAMSALAEAWKTISEVAKDLRRAVE
jgi:hypothetical protein